MRASPSFLPPGELHGLPFKLRRGEGLADFLRTGVRQVYGYGSEKLVEFGMQPLRPRSRPGVSEPATPPSPETPDPADSKATDEAGE